jgi:hypothetical protein
MTEQDLAVQPDSGIRDALLNRFRLLTEAGLTVATTAGPVDEALINEGSITELPVRLGVHGKIPNGEGFIYPLVMELPNNRSGNQNLREAVRHSSCETLLKKLDTGWSDTSTDSALRYWMGVQCTTDEQFKAFVRSLPARAAKQAEQVISSLLFAKSEVLGAVASGVTGDLTIISPRELLGLGVVLDEMSETSEPLISGYYNIRHNSPHSNSVRDSFNRRIPTEEVAYNLAELGWIETTTQDRVSQFERGTERGELILDNGVFVVGPQTEKPTIFRAFDLIASGEKFEGSIEKTATWLVEEGHALPTIEVLSASGDRIQIEMNQDTKKVERAFTEAIQRARSSADSTIPLALSKEADGVHQGIISYLPSGVIRTWTEQNGAGLLLAAAQPVFSKTAKNGEKKITFSHRVDPSIVRAVLDGLASGVLSPVDHIATEPVLTADGQIASTPGYSRVAKALVAIPHRDRNKWSEKYRVPKTPTRDEARAAWDFLMLELTSDFHYRTPVDRARHGAYLLTCVGRPTLRGSIGFIFIANNVGAGKSLLATIGRQLSQGHPGAADFGSMAAADAETEKKLGGLVVANGRFLHCDEVIRGSALTGTTVTKAISSNDSEFQIRRLGQSELLPVSGLIVTAAGNNVTLGGDTHRRFLPIHLLFKGKGSVLMRSGFRHESILEYILEERPALVAAAHTILLHGIQNEPPHEIPGLAFSHDWARRILGALAHIEIDGKTADELALEGWLEGVNANNTLGEEWGELMADLWKNLEGKSGPAELLRTIATTSRKQNIELPSLPIALLGVRSSNPKDANRVWGKALGSIKDTDIPFEGVVYRAETLPVSEKSHQTASWKIVALTEEGDPLTPGEKPQTAGDAAPSEGTAQAKEWNALLADWYRRQGSTANSVDVFMRMAVSQGYAHTDPSFEASDDPQVEARRRPVNPDLPESLASPLEGWGEDENRWVKILTDISGTYFSDGTIEYGLEIIQRNDRRPLWAVMQGSTRPSSIRSVTWAT